MHRGRRQVAQPADRLTIALTGHFGEFLQGRYGPDGPVVLVTLPCPSVRASVSFRPAMDAPLAAPGPLGPLMRQAAREARRAAGCRALGGVLHLSHDVVPGGGAGLSTMAALGTVRSVAAATGVDLADREARLCLAAEGATDPLMQDRPARHLWASRQARSLAALPPPPPMRAIGGFIGPPMHTDPTSADFADVSDLVGRWVAACQAQDPAAAGAVASASAARSGRFKDAAAALPRLAADLGALGVAVAHTGSAAALLYPAGGADLGPARCALTAMGMQAIRVFAV
ncbi:MAG: propanediol utilization protein [Pseudomonadota bacterium]